MRETLSVGARHPGDPGDGDTLFGQAFGLLLGCLTVDASLLGLAAVDLASFVGEGGADVIALLLDLPHFIHIWLSRHALGVAQPPIWATVGMNLLLLQSWWTRFLGLNDPGWSLSTEAFFYALFPFVGALLWRLRTRGAVAWALIIYLAGNAAVLFFIGRPVELAALRYNPASHLYEFLLGILTARLHFILQENPRRTRWLRGAAPWLLAACVGTYLAIVPWTTLLPLQLLAHGIFSPLFCAALLALASGNVGVNKIFSAAWSVLLGEASYSLYLIHVPIFFMLRLPLEKYGGPLFLVYVCLCIGLSVLSYLYIEKPSRRWILRKWGVRSRESEAAAAVAQ